MYENIAKQAEKSCLDMATILFAADQLFSRAGRSPGRRRSRSAAPSPGSSAHSQTGNDIVSPEK